MQNYPQDPLNKPTKTEKVCGLVLTPKIDPQIPCPPQLVGKYDLYGNSLLQRSNHYNFLRFTPLDDFLKFINRRGITAIGVFHQSNYYLIAQAA